jgi:integrase
MAHLIGLFERGGSYYLRVVLPQHHPLRNLYRSGKVVQSLGKCSYREAIRIGTQKRAEVLWGSKSPSLATASHIDLKPSQPPIPKLTEVKPSASLREVYELWIKSSPKSADTVASCGRALKLFEEYSGNPPLSQLTRAQGDQFRAKLRELPTTSKTARDRFNWIKSLLKYASQDLELISKSPWVGLEIKSRTTSQRQPWTNEHLSILLGHEIWQKGSLPKDSKAGGLAAYWVPLLGIYTGARCSELCQLMLHDIETKATIPTIRITDEGEGQNVKSEAGHRTIPIHSELIRLGFLDYVKSLEGPKLWPNLPQRDGKPGGYFSQWFGTLRKSLGIPDSIVFHSFRHTARSTLSSAGAPETVIDRLMGHESQGSVGAKVYTHIDAGTLKVAIESIRDTSLNTLPILPHGG